MNNPLRHDEFRRAGAQVVDAALGETGRPGAAADHEPLAERPELWHVHDEATGAAIATPAAVIAARSSQIGLTGNMAECSFENWRELTSQHMAFGRWAAGWAKGAAQARQGDKGHSLYLSGACGCGKTHLAVSCLRVLVGLGLRARFQKAPTLMAELRSAWGDEVLWEHVRPEVLCLDDLGSSAGTEMQLERLRIILGERYDERRITIITTNFPIKSREAEKLLGPRLLSRILGSYAIGDINLPDYRALS